MKSWLQFWITHPYYVWQAWRLERNQPEPNLAVEENGLYPEMF